jgi:DNA-binding NarL/FixJ family response regulator
VNVSGGDSGPAIPVRVMVVDDHPIWRDAVARDLVEAGYDVTAVIGEGAQAIRVAPAARPDVVVLDLQLPDLPGVEVVRRLIATDPAIRVLMLSASGDQQDVLHALKAGALGYLVKSAKRAELVEAVARTAAGDPVFTVGTAGLVLGEYRRLAAVSAPPARHAPPHRTGDRGAAPGRQGPLVQADRRTARRIAPDRAEPRPELARQAASSQPG